MYDSIFNLVIKKQNKLEHSLTSVEHNINFMTF